MAKELLKGDNTSEGAFDNLMNGFSEFMKEQENNEDMKEALESVV